MIKVFISQPMKDKTEQEIFQERDRAIELVKAKYCDVEIIDSFFKEYPFAPETKNKPLAWLASSIKLLANADVAVFCKGWKDYRGCRIEYRCAVDYGIDVLEL